MCAENVNLNIMNCKKCNHQLTLEEGEYDYYGFCPKCKLFAGVVRQRGVCCIKPSPILVRHTIRDGRFQVKRQCTHCATSLGDSLPFKSVDDIYSLPDSFYHLMEIEDEKRNLEYRSMEKKIMSNLKEKLDIVTDYKDELQIYNDYLDSADWKAKRILVLKRDNYLCQSCLVSKAKEVHHLTYKHFKNEPLFDLISVCRPCHISITQMDHFESYKEIKHIEVQVKKHVMSVKKAS
ncbi:MAG: hypothetical protein K9G40_00115 [Crocinitomicaceae bacterium]|nr:hypothetical protein [Crocinitomicaceae bacterium]MCF8433295.1 hypothetical protein [Crocinitomicaceae bacterium]